MSESVKEASVEATPSNTGGDVEMTEGNNVRDSELPFADDGAENAPAPRVSFVQYLKSPIVTLTVGSGEEETLLTAHQGLLVQSPFFTEACAQFIDDGSPRAIDLGGEDLEAVSCFLEFLYTGEYFPKKLPGTRALESDPSIPKVDETGNQLLKHAKVYTLAQKFQLPQLEVLASSKIHCVNSTAKGEIAYARYVYEFTTKDDTTVRAPVANFWASRSHTLRAEAEDEFRDLCLSYPQFGYDVLTRVLDEKLKRERNEKMHPSSASGSARKRPRHSNV